ncbi:MAG: hypothetical protein JNK48_15370 [Bryobacterales bacterium]|nr:hypothetical protein [Bryobacterales bacterium]
MRCWVRHSAAAWKKAMNAGGWKDGWPRCANCLQARFGALPQAVEERLLGAPEAELAEMVDRGLKASSLGELFPGVIPDR